MPESHAARGSRRGRRQLTVLGEEVHAARLAAGLSLAVVARAAGMSIAELSRIERGLAPWLDVLPAARVCSVVGLDLSVRSFPGSDPIRDAGHARLSRRSSWSSDGGSSCAPRSPSATRVTCGHGTWSSTTGRPGPRSSWRPGSRMPRRWCDGSP